MKVWFSNKEWDFSFCKLLAVLFRPLISFKVWVIVLLMLNLVLNFTQLSQIDTDFIYVWAAISDLENELVLHVDMSKQIDGVKHK